MDYRGGGAVERGEHVGALKLSIDHMAAKGMQGRGVMIDLEHHFGRGEKFVSFDELMNIMKADNVTVEEGDLVCFRTGYDRVILDMQKNPDAATLAANPCAALDGRDERILNWITRSGVVALISDNRAVEASPSRPCEGEDHCASLPIHAHCLFKRRRLSRRDLALVGIGRLAAVRQAVALSADRAAVAAAGRGRLAGQRGRDGVAAYGRSSSEGSAGSSSVSTR